MTGPNNTEIPMRTIALPTLLLAAWMAVSCQGPTGHPPAVHDHPGEDTLTEGHGHAAHTVQAVVLDDGKTWAANPETTDGIAAMRNTLDRYDPAHGDSTRLKQELEAELNGIFTACTMTGEAHEQLHNFLLPIIALLERSGGTLTGDQREELAKHLASYPAYFH